jgi:EAL domain-containing protein (putative c-di-GMP-specific phosphodiesterase class I)
MKRNPLLIGDPVDQHAELKAERDRFAALALCASDVLIELDSDLSIVFAGGATTSLIGRDPQDLVRKPFLDQVARQDRPMMREALGAAVRGARIRNLIVHMEGALGQRPSFSVVGYHLSDMDGHYFLSLRSDTQTLLFGEGDPRRLVPGGDSGLPNGRCFAALVGGRVHAHASGESCQFTLIRLDGLFSLWQRLDRLARQSLAEAIGGSLRANALQGEFAGQFDHESYGLIHTNDVDLQGLTEKLSQLAINIDPKREGVRIVMASVAMDVSGMGEPEQIKALMHTINQFTDRRPDDFTIKSLTAGLSDMIGETIHKITEFRSVVAAGNFAMAFQPIVDLGSRAIHHFEVLVRFTSFGGRFSSYEAITFAEQTGLICDFDLAMCEKAMRWLETTPLGRRQLPLAVNLSGNSIGTPTFVKALHDLLKKYERVRHLVMFEITESARITDLRSVKDVVRGLRQAGHKVCLDDFGAGASAFHYLRALDVDVVKIDGIYVRDALKSNKGAAFLKAMAALCNDLGIEVVAEMVEDNASVAFLRQCGIDYGQGYLFGRPSLDIADFYREAEARHAGPVPDESSLPAASLKPASEL